MNDVKNLINWVELSRLLAGNESSVSRTRCPKKYQTIVDDLILHVKAWKEKNIKTADLEPKSDEEADT